jgi:hypothetical protein
MVAFESELDATFDDPSPVEAYLAESEASLLEVAHEAELPHPIVEPGADAPAAASEPPPIPALASPAIDTPAIQAPADSEPIAFEDDGDIAFEPAVEFAFDEAGEPSFEDEAPGAIDPGPGAASMFDATYTPPALVEGPVAASQFDVMLPRPATESTPSSFFDARPSDSYGDPPQDATIAVEAEGVMFEEASEDGLAIDDRVAADPAPAPDEPAPVDLADAFTNPPAPVPETEDRVLLQFAATVPHDLAELRRIAADNQW